MKIEENLTVIKNLIKKGIYWDREGEQMKSDLPERTFKFVVQIVKLCKVLDEKPGVSRTLVNQLLRSGTSIGANVL